MANRTDVIKTIKLLQDAYPARKIENLAGFVDAAEKALWNVRPDVLLAAAEKMIAISKFFPTIAELHEKAVDLQAAVDESVRVFPQWVRRFEHMGPEQWTRGDYEDFRMVMGRPVDWETEPSDAPWMAWKSERISV